MLVFDESYVAFPVPIEWRQIQNYSSHWLIDGMLHIEIQVDNY